MFLLYHLVKNSQEKKHLNLEVLSISSQLNLAFVGKLG